jgi:hypothetical protein
MADVYVYADEAGVDEGEASSVRDVDNMSERP